MQRRIGMKSRPIWQRRISVEYRVPLDVRGAATLPQRQTPLSPRFISLARAVSTALRSMDSNNSNSTDSFLPKVEISDIELDSYRIPRPHWNPQNTKRLIEMLETECHELWNPKNPGYKNRTTRLMKYQYLAESFATSIEEIMRKVHNLRTQYNSELRKIKKKGAEGGAVSGWEYFDMLSFLKTNNVNDTSSADPLELDPGNLEMGWVNMVKKVEFQVNGEEEEFPNPTAKVAKETAQSLPGQSIRAKKPVVCVAATAPLPVTTNAHHILPEQTTVRSRCDVDECQIFGDFLASELRSLSSNESRKKLKRIIQKAILKVGEEDDAIND